MNAILTGFVVNAPDTSQSCRKIGLAPTASGNALALAPVDVLAEYIFPWTTCVEKFGNCERILLHDGLPNELRQRYPWVRFEEFPPQYKHSAWVRRCQQWYEYLVTRPDLERVFFTDVNDVGIFSDPFAWHASLGLSWDVLLIGEEWTLFRDNPWFKNGYEYYPPKVRRLFEDVLPNSAPACIGLWGGNRVPALALLKRLCELFDEYEEFILAQPTIGWDMVFFNYALRSGEVFDRYASFKMEDFGPNNTRAGVTIRGQANPFLHDRPSVMKRLRA